MSELASLLWGTLALRPYVFAFLVVHGWSAGRALGARRAAALTGIVWATAFVAEWTSTRVGFPFGFYAYTGDTRGKELYLSNVPFVDSLSFAFLAWGSYALALVLLRPSGAGATWEGGPSLAQRTAGRTLAVATACFVLIDVIIDPLAVRGDRWFLGRIFEYPSGGIYFGVPLSNFAGWGGVGAVGLGLYAALDRRWERRGRPAPPPRRAGFAVGAALWFGVAAFNIIITFAIGEMAIGLAGLAISSAPAALLAARAVRWSPGRAARPWQRETLRS
jgi:putative membrane protein